jgi:hypothetical protein
MPRRRKGGDPPANLAPGRRLRPCPGLPRPRSGTLSIVQAERLARALRTTLSEMFAEVEGLFHDFDRCHFPAVPDTM